VAPSKSARGGSGDGQRVLVTGATGKQGGGLARLLLAGGHRVRAFTRKPDSPAAEELRKAGAEIVSGQFEDRASVERAARGMDVVFLVMTPYEQGAAAELRLGKLAVDAVHAAGVPYVVYSSVGNADTKTGIPHFDSKFQVEEHLKSSGMEYSIVAPVAFSENLLAPWTLGGLAQGTLLMGVLPDRKLQMISLAEIAEFTALAVEQRSKFRGHRVDIASVELTPVEIARQLSELLGKEITPQQIPVEQLRKQSEDLAKMTEWFNRVGYSVDIPRLKREYPQVHWRSFREWAAAQTWSAARSN